MNRTRQRPPRTRAVAVLDLVLAVLHALRRVALAPVRLASRPGAGRLLARGMIVAAVAVVLGTGLVVAALLRTPDGFAPMGVGPEPDAKVATPPGPGRAELGPNASAASHAPRTPEPTPTGRTGPAAPAPATPSGTPGGTALLTAAYSTEQRGLVSYHAALDITNTGGAPARDWTVVITLPRPTQSIAEVRGATVTRDDATWTFVPDRDTREVPAGGAVRVTFRVDGAALGPTEPTGCTVNGHPCGGEFRSAPAGR